MKQKVYLAGGMSNDWHRIIINKFKDKFIFFNPRNHNLAKPEEFTIWDLHFVKQADIIFGYLEKENPSGYGLALEIGYANALNKTIILVDEKSNSDNEFEKRFQIVNHSASVVFKELEDGINYLDRFSVHL